MSEGLISKKDLLEEMQISYGQLYRWKRKRLIPEEWFIKKSVSTGQETFFPREKIIDRINKILELKDDASLDELAQKFTLNIKDLNIRRDYLVEQEFVSLAIIERFETLIEYTDLYKDDKIFALLIYNELLKSGVLAISEVNEITLAVYKNYEEMKNEDNILIIKRKLGVLFYYIISEKNEIELDPESILIKRLAFKSVLEIISNLK